MGSSVTGTLDEAYQRLHATGPEFDGWLSNHGPMAAEAMARRGHAGQVHRWLDGYMGRLEEFPRGTGPIGPPWQDALGDPRRIADWTAYFQREVTEQPWRQVLETWWLRLLPGVAAAATHGVIRAGHAVRALTQDGEDADHLAELAHGLAYWAARWQPVPGTPATGPPPAAAPSTAGGPAGAGLVAADALATVPRIADQSGGIRDRLTRLAGLPGWPAALAAPQIPASPEALMPWLASLVDAATTRYLRYGHGNGVMLVHSATAPNAIFRTLPELSEELWAPSVAAAWAAAAALTAIYAPAAPQAGLPDAPGGPQAAEETFARAVEHGDEHAIKFADTAADVYARTGDPSALAAAVHATHLIDPAPQGA
jgi:hypothetical protein